MKAELFERIYNLSNSTEMPIRCRTMGKTSAKVCAAVGEPRGSSADEILGNIAKDANEIASGIGVDENIKSQVVTNVVYDKMTKPENSDYQKAILDTVLESDEKVLFDKILEEDVCAGDFSGFAPEHMLGDIQKKEDDGNSSSC